MKNIIRETDKSAGEVGKILLPVDFSPLSDTAIKVGFALAERLSKEVELLHASLVPSPGIFPQFPSDFDGIDNEDEEIEEVEMAGVVYRQSKRGMQNLTSRIAEQQKEGVLPDIKFDSAIIPGMPEEVIAEYCSLHPSTVIVMTTRSRSRRVEELVGSVTAEVIDNCRVPVFSVPEHYVFEGFEKIVRLCAFCYLEGYDYDCVAHLMELFGNPKVEIYLFPVYERSNDGKGRATMAELRDRLMRDYPESTFNVVDTAASELKTEAASMFATDHIQLIIAPNKKRNIFARFFKPGLPHRILFEKDIPMLAIPV